MNRTRTILILAFLALQLALPLRGLKRDPLERPAEFSWNLVGDRYSCSAVYAAARSGGRVDEVDLDRFFRPASRASSVLYRSRLPGFHRFLCDELGRDDPLERLEGICLCTWSQRDVVQLVREDVDICASPDDSVLP